MSSQTGWNRNPRQWLSCTTRLPPLHTTYREIWPVLQWLRLLSSKYPNIRYVTEGHVTLRKPNLRFWWTVFFINLSGWALQTYLSVKSSFKWLFLVTMLTPSERFFSFKFLLQICLWTGVGMILLILSSVCCIIQMEVLPDSLLYAKFQSARTHKND